MSCDKCDKEAEQGMVAWYRWGAANVGLIGCREHILEILNVLNKEQNERK